MKSHFISNTIIMWATSNQWGQYSEAWMCMREEAGYKTAAGSLKMFLVERQEGHSGSQWPGPGRARQHFPLSVLLIQTPRHPGHCSRLTLVRGGERTTTSLGGWTILSLGVVHQYRNRKWFRSNSNDKVKILRWINIQKCTMYILHVWHFYIFLQPYELCWYWYWALLWQTSRIAHTKYTTALLPTRNWVLGALWFIYTQ